MIKAETMQTTEADKTRNMLQPAFSRDSEIIAPDVAAVAV